jgi:hypothetical protein
MKKKKLIILAILFFSLLGGGWYVYREFNRKVKDLSKVRADLELSAGDLFSTFEKNEANGNTLYLDKIISVTGVIKAVEKDATGHFTVVLGESVSLSSVRCSMDSVHQQDVSTLVTGTRTTIKGACTGFNADELLGSDVIMNRCVVSK